MSQGGGGGRKDKKGRKLAPEIDSIAKTTATPCAHAITGEKFCIRKRMDENDSTKVLHGAPKNRLK